MLPVVLAAVYMLPAVLAAVDLLSVVLPAVDMLLVDVEMNVFKLYLYFKSYTVKSETLKFCDLVETKFEMVLGYAQMTG